MSDSHKSLIKSLPQRPHAHVLGYYAENFVASKFPPEWISRTVSYDYGLDLNVEIVRNYLVTGLNFSVQVKALAKDPARTSYIPVRLNSRTINYMQARLEPVILVVFVEQRGEAYWCWADEIPMTADRETVTVRVPLDRPLTSTDWTAFASSIKEQSARRPSIDVSTAERLDRFGRYSVDLSRQRLLFKEEVDELESLARNEEVRESELQEFIERHPEVFIGGEYLKMHAQIRLEGESGVLIPDFFLEHVSGFCDIMELKLPTVRMAAGKPTRRRLSAAMHEAAAQTRVYRDFFDEDVHRRWFEDKYKPLRSFKPRTLLLIGRDSCFTDPLEKRRLEVSLGDYRIMTYDDLLRIARARQVE